MVRNRWRPLHNRIECLIYNQRSFSYSMDVHPSRELVASGQRAGRERKSQAHVRIWSTESLQTLYVFGMGELDAGVSSVAFSQLVCHSTTKQHKSSYRARVKLSRSVSHPN